MSLTSLVVTRLTCSCPDLLRVYLPSELFILRKGVVPIVFNSFTVVRQSASATVVCPRECKTRPRNACSGDDPIVRGRLPRPVSNSAREKNRWTHGPKSFWKSGVSVVKQAQTTAMLISMDDQLATEVRSHVRSGLGYWALSRTARIIEMRQTLRAWV